MAIASLSNFWSNKSTPTLYKPLLPVLSSSSETAILLIDDSSISRDLIKPELEKLGFKVDQVTSHIALEKRLASFPKYDVVLLDQDPLSEALN